MTWRIRGCPHCGGDTFLDKDVNNGWVENCLQCGYDVVLKKVDSKLQVVQTHRKARCPASNLVPVRSL